jgi:hypothetical protein
VKLKTVPDQQERIVEGQELEITPETLDDNEEVVVELPDQGVHLPFGGDLDYAQLRALQLSRPVRTVSLFGEHKSGKTTLVSEIYHAFCGGPFANHMFSESQTIAGFERRLHAARLASGRSTEDTARTSRNKDLTFLHLRLLAEGSRPVDLAWADRAGEDFRVLAGATEASEIPPELGTSQHVTFIIDGAKLADASERTNAIQRARQSLRKLIDLGVVGKRHNISFVTTKADLFQSSGIKERAEAAIIGLRENCKHMKSDVSSLSFFETSVRKEVGTESRLTIPFGLDLLLKHWTAEVVAFEGQVFQPKLTRQMDRVLTRFSHGGSLNG